MKKIYLLTAFLCTSCFVTSAQDEATVSFMGYQSIQDSLMQHLDKNKISTGALYDRVNPIARINMESRSLPALTMPCRPGTSSTGLHMIKIIFCRWNMLKTSSSRTSRSVMP